MGIVVFLTFMWKFWGSIFVAAYRLLPFARKPPKDVRGEIVLVTGAGHGMGRLEAAEFAKLGATVIVVDINEQNNDETADQLRETGGRVHAYTCDVSKRQNIKNLAAEIREEVGDVTILVNNAGVIYVADILSLAEEKIERTFSVNVLAHFWLIREFLPAMKRENHGHIVALASLAGYTGTPYMTDYCASKHAVVGLCDALRRELRWQKYNGIHVTYVCPSFVSTGFIKNPKLNVGKILRPEEVVDEFMRAVLHNTTCVTLPKDQRFNFFIRSILPVDTLELIFDHVSPECDKVDMKKEN